MAYLRCLQRLSEARILTIQASSSSTFGIEVATVRTCRTSSAMSAGAVDVFMGRFQSSHPVLGLALASHSICTYSSRGFMTGSPIMKFTTSFNRNGAQRCLHTSTYVNARKWESHNRIVYPPQKPGEPPRMAEVYYSRLQIKYSMRKMWYIATFVKGMMIDDALTQLQFIKKKGAGIVREILLEAQEEAVKNHNVEFKSNLHIAESFVGKGEYENAMRIHAKGRFSIMDLVYCHYYVVLREGPPPKKIETTGYDQAQHYMDSLRKRTIIHSI